MCNRIKTYHVHLRPTGRPPAACLDDLKKFPGVKVFRGGFDWAVPHHALSLVLGTAQKYAITFDTPTSFPLGLEPPWSARPSWEQVETKLRATGFIRDFVLDGFLTKNQKDALQYTWGKPGAHLWHPTGAGKTLSGILWAALQGGPTLIITRAVSRIQYGREVEKFSHWKPYVVRPASSRRKNSKTMQDYLEEEHERHVVIVGWSSLRSLKEELTAVTWGSLIVDESHRGKNPKRWAPVPLDDLPKDPDLATQEALRQEREAKARGGFIPDNDAGTRLMMVPVESTASVSAQIAGGSLSRLLTSATAIKDRIRDLYAQLDMAEPGSWGSTTAWMDRYADRKRGAYGGYDTRGSSNLGELKDRIQHVVHRVSYEDAHRDLPPKRRQSVYIAPEEQNRPTGGFASELKKAFKRGPAAVMECKRAQAASSKRSAVMSLVDGEVQSGHKITIFTGRIRDVDILAEKLTKKYKDKVKVWAGHGKYSPTERQEMVDEYMAHKGPCILVGTGDSFGESLNIQDTDAAFFVMLPWTPGQIRQWEGRFCRYGQKRPVVIYYVIAEETVDEHVADVLISKFPGVEKVVQDTELAEAKHVIAGIDDEEAIMDEILDCLELTG
jgi:SNF2 family DNA or RNA helicase